MHACTHTHTHTDTHTHTQKEREKERERERERELSYESLADDFAANNYISRHQHIVTSCHTTTMSCDSRCNERNPSKAAMLPLTGVPGVETTMTMNRNRLHSSTRYHHL